jgi:hypothetical protein
MNEWNRPLACAEVEADALKLGVNEIWAGARQVSESIFGCAGRGILRQSAPVRWEHFHATTSRLAARNLQVIGPEGLPRMGFMQDSAVRAVWVLE